MPTFKATRLTTPCKRSLVADKSGVAMVEFAMAIMPVLMIFFGMVQWSIVAYVHLLVKHAAYTIVRCEAVVHPGMPDAGKEDTDCLATDPTNRTSVIGILFNHVAGVSSGDFSISTSLAGAAEQKQDSVTVTLNYKCSIPLGNVLACTSARVMTLTETAAFPNQGSAYQAIRVTSS